MDTAQPRRPSRADLESQLQKLQDSGIVDLDAPLRDAVPALARSLVQQSAVASSWWVIASGDNPHAICECETD